MPTLLLFYSIHISTLVLVQASQSLKLGHSSIQDLYSTCLPVREDERNVDLKLGGVPCAAPQQRMETVTSRTHQEDADESSLCITSVLQGRSAQSGFPGKSALRGSPICSIDNKQGDVSILAELLGIEYEKGRCRPLLG